MTYRTPKQRDPRYLSIPTLMASLLCAHLVQMACEPLGLNALSCIVAYLFGLALPIVLKRALMPDDEYADRGSLDPNDVHRLPTSRFITTPNERAP